MQVVPRDADQDVGSSRIDRNRLVDCGRQRSTAFGVDQDRDQLVAGAERSFDDHVAFGDEDAGHVPVGKLTLLAQDVVPEPLEDVESGIVGIVDGYPVIEQVRCRSGGRRDPRGR
jgi:hypothetical protein